MNGLFYADETVTLWQGDALEVLRRLPANSVDACVTSPPYFGLRDYGVDGQIGLEASPAEYVERLVEVFVEVQRVLTDDGTLWINLGDSYASKARGSDAGWDKSRLTNPGSVQKAQAAALRKTGERHRGKAAGIGEKNMLGMPWRVAFALQDSGWTLRNDIIWSKPNPMPESVTDRLTTSYEHVFMLTQQPRGYWFDLDAIRERGSGRASGNHTSTASAYAEHTSLRYGGNPGSTLHTRPNDTRQPRDVWTIPTQPFPGAHFAVMPLALAERCVLAGCRPGGVVLDPFSGSGTTGLATARHGRRYVGIDLSADYLDLSLRTRLAQAALTDGEVSA